MMIAQVEPFFSLSDSAKVYGIFVGLKALLGFLQEVDGELDVCMLSRSEDCEHSILDWIELVRERLDAGLVQGQQVRVLGRVEGPGLEILNQIVTDLMPESRIEDGLVICQSVEDLSLFSSDHTYFSLN